MGRFIGRLRRALEAARGVDAAFLFGSSSRGRLREGGDVDVAVLYAPSLSPSGKALAQERLRKGIERATGFECDLVDLAKTSTAVRFHLLKTGRCLLEKNARRCRLFVAYALQDYFDFQPVYERMERRLLDRLKAA